MGKKFCIIDGCDRPHSGRGYCSSHYGRLRRHGDPLKFGTGPTTHGMAKGGKPAPEYIIWQGMLSRCRYPKHIEYHNYGGRGITVCERWKDFALFYADMGPRPSNKHSIDRIDFNGNYEPSNCRWVDSKEQARNKSRCVSVVRSDGVRFRTIVEAAESVGAHKTSVGKCAAGQRRTAGGYGWKYEKEQP